MYMLYVLRMIYYRGKYDADDHGLNEYNDDNRI